MRAVFVVTGVAVLLAALGSVDLLLSRSKASTRTKADPGFPWLEKLNADAKEVAGRGDYALAAHMFSRGLQESRGAGWKRGELLFLTNLANSHNASHEFGSAIEGYLAARRLADESGNSVMAGILASNIAGLYETQGALSEASRYIEGARDALSARAGRRYLPTVLLLQAKIDSRQGNPRQAISVLRQAVDTADQVGDEQTGGGPVRERPLRAVGTVGGV